MNSRYLHCEILWWSSSDCQTYSCQTFFQRSGEKCGFVLCGTNNANIVVLLLKDVTFIDDGKSLFPPSDKISPENSTQIFGNCKYLFLSPFPFNTDSSFQKHCILGYHCLFLFFSFFLESVRLFLFLHVPCCQSCLSVTGNLLNCLRRSNYIFSSSDFVFKLRTMTWWLRSCSLGFGDHLR